MTSTPWSHGLGGPKPPTAARRASRCTYCVAVTPCGLLDVQIRKEALGREGRLGGWSRYRDEEDTIVWLGGMGLITTYVYSAAGHRWRPRLSISNTTPPMRSPPDPYMPTCRSPTSPPNRTPTTRRPLHRAARVRLFSSPPPRWSSHIYRSGENEQSSVLSSHTRPTLRFHLSQRSAALSWARRTAYMLCYVSSVYHHTYACAMKSYAPYTYRPPTRPSPIHPYSKGGNFSSLLRTRSISDSGSQFAQAQSPALRAGAGRDDELAPRRRRYVLWNVGKVGNMLRAVMRGSVRGGWRTRVRAGGRAGKEVSCED